MKKCIFLIAVISMISCDHLQKHFDQMSGDHKKDSTVIVDSANNRIPTDSVKK